MSFRLIRESTTDPLNHGPSAPAGAAMKPDDAGFLWFDPAAYHSEFAADVPQTLTRVVTAAEQPIAVWAFGEPVSQAAWKTKPTWYVSTTNDRAVEPETQQWMAQRIGATTVNVPSSHLAPVPPAAEVAAVIDQAAKAQSGQ